jgi:deoxyxylulose-5-phosphate synthase
MTPGQNEKPTAVRIDLTDEQKQRVAAVVGDGRLAAGPVAIEMSVEELERRILPGSNLN